MKKVCSFIFVLFCALATMAENGVYNSLKDFKEGKLSKKCESMNIEQFGGRYVITLINGDNKEKIVLRESDIWGYKRELTDYRIIDGLPRAIATKGEIWIYSGYMDKKEIFKGDTAYYKESNVYPYASKGIDGELVLVHNMKELFKLMDQKEVPRIDKELRAFKVSSFLEDVADYYNSTRPGYLSSRIKVFFYEGLNRTANGKRSISF